MFDASEFKSPEFLLTFLKKILGSLDLGSVTSEILQIKFSSEGVTVYPNSRFTGSFTVNHNGVSMPFPAYALLQLVTNHVPLPSLLPMIGGGYPLSRCPEILDANLSELWRDISHTAGYSQWHLPNRDHNHHHLMHKDSSPLSPENLHCILNELRRATRYLTPPLNPNRFISENQIAEIVNLYTTIEAQNAALIPAIAQFTAHAFVKGMAINSIKAGLKQYLKHQARENLYWSSVLMKSFNVIETGLRVNRMLEATEWDPYRSIPAGIFELLRLFMVLNNDNSQYIHSFLIILNLIFVTSSFNPGNGEAVANYLGMEVTDFLITSTIVLGTALTNYLPNSKSSEKTESMASNKQRLLAERQSEPSRRSNAPRIEPQI